jgi:hypothetical protein
LAPVGFGSIEELLAAARRCVDAGTLDCMAHAAALEAE